MTDQRQHLTTEDFAGRTPTERDSLDPRQQVAHQPDAYQPNPDQEDLHQPNAGRQGLHQSDLHQSEREPVEQTPAGRDVLEPDLTDQERFDREPVADDGSGTHQSTHQEHAGYDGREDAVAQEPPAELSAVSTTAGDTPLFTTDDATDYQAEWRALQADFVDDPREAVQRADELVAQVMQTLATTFNEHKHALEEQWHRGDEVQTEELRQALKRYRSFFDRLLSV
ncbi:hypothetical protein ACRAKI_08250 [Saccharothrix isguenensis]